MMDRAACAIAATMCLYAAELEAGARPEICATSPILQPDGAFLVYGDGFDQEGTQCGLLYREDERSQNATEAQLRAWLSEHLRGTVTVGVEGWVWRDPLRRERHRMLVFARRNREGSGPTRPREPGRSGPVALRARSAAATSEVFIANRPEIWGLSPFRPVIGERCQFWGLNLGTRVALIDQSGQIMSVGNAPACGSGGEGHSEGRFFRSFATPPNLRPGTYRLYNWAGLGAAGWSDGYEVEMRAPYPPPVRTVRLNDFGALGDGHHDDTEAFDTALSELAKSGGGRVIIPVGRFRITRWLPLQRDIQLHGVSAATSIIMASAPDGGVFETAGRGRLRRVATPNRCAPVIWLASGCALRHLTIDGTDTGNRPFSSLVLVGEIGHTSRDVSVIDCRFVHRRPYQLRCRGLMVSGGPGPEAGHAGIVTDSLRVEGCEFRVSSICIQWVKDGRNVGARIRGNTFATIPPHGAHTVILPHGTDRCLYEANVFENGGRTKTEQGPRPSAGNATIKHNCWRRNIIRNGRKGDGETIMYETGSPGWYGKAKHAGEHTITAANVDRYWATPTRRGAWRANELAGGYCVVVEGRGLGQWGLVAGNNSDTLELDRQWRIAPDHTTTFSVLREGSVENLHLCNQVFYTSGYSGNYRTSLRNVWAHNEAEGHSLGLKFWNTSSPTYVTAFNVAFRERYHSVGGIEIINDMKFYQEQRALKNRPDSVRQRDPWHQHWLSAFKSSRRAFGNEIRGCIVNQRRWPFTQNGGLYTGSIRLRVERHNLQPGTLAGIALTTRMEWPFVAEEPREEVVGLPKTPMSWNLLYGNTLSRCPVGIRLSTASTSNFVLGNTFVECGQPLLDLGQGNVAVGSVAVRSGR